MEGLTGLARDVSQACNLVPVFRAAKNQRVGGRPAIPAQNKAIDTIEAILLTLYILYLIHDTSNLRRITPTPPIYQSF